MSWKTVKLGSVITQRKEFITIDNSVEYKRCRVQVNRKGVVLRDIVKGILINTKKQQVCKEGDFLVAEIDAKVGGYGFVGKDLEGAIVSSHYFLFEVDENKMLKSYLAWLIKTDIIQEQINSKGSTNYAAIRPSNVLSFEVPLPSIKEQKEIVARLNNVDDEYSSLQNELTLQQTYLKQLRQSILQEAVQGKLTQQNPTDEPASKLLERIKAEKQKLIKEGKLKKEKELPPITEDEIPFELPKGWAWCRLGKIAEFINGDRSKNYPNQHEYVSDGIAWINTGHIKPDGSLSLSDMNYITKEKFNSLRGGKIEKGDLVYCLRGATIGKTAFVDQFKKGAIASSLMIIRLYAEINRWYAYYYLTSPLGKSEIKKFDNGSAQPNLSANSVTIYLFPLPPLSEQHRIVAKVQHLMQMVNLLEQQVEQSQIQAQQLLQAVLKEAFSNKEKVYEENEVVTMAAEKTIAYD